MEYGNIVLASSKRGFVPAGIRWFTGSKFSHSLVTMPDILDTPMCMEAGGSGVDMLRFDTGYADNTDQGYEVWRVKLPQAVKDAACRQILTDLPVGYGFLAYPWFIWRRICWWFGKDIKAQANWSQAGFICSELCVVYLTACGLGHVFAAYGEGSISAQDVRDVMAAHPELFEKVTEVRMT